MQKAFEKIVQRLEEAVEHCLYMHDWQGQSAYEDAIEIVNQVAEEYSRTAHYGCNTNGEHERCDDCGVADKCPNYKKQLFEQFGNSGQLNDGWIPCSSGVMPKMEQTVLVTVAKECVLNEEVITVDYDEEYMQYFEDGSFLAWQPLPAPYQPKGE